jgi:hypothetical protein
MKTHETATPVRAFDRAYINGQFVTPHGTQIVDLVNPTDNKVIGKVTMADEIDTRKAIGAAKEAFNTFSQSSKAYRMELLQQLHDPKFGSGTSIVVQCICSKMPGLRTRIAEGLATSAKAAQFGA